MFGLVVKDRVYAARGDIKIPPPPKTFKISVKVERDVQAMQKMFSKQDRRVSIEKATRNDLRPASVKEANDRMNAKFRKMKQSAEKTRQQKKAKLS
jgi:hypothetical protein